MKFENLTKKQLIDELKKISSIEDCYQYSVDCAPWGILVYDQNGKALVFNDQLERITGFSKDEITDIPSWLSLIHPTNKKYQKILKDLKSTPSKEKVLQWEATIKCKDGQQRGCLFCSNLTSSGFRTIFVTDVTEKKRTLNSLLASEERYRSLFNILPYGGELIDTTGKIINCSLSTAQMLGYTVSELIGKQITEFLTPDSQKIFQKKMPNLLSGEFQSAEIRMVQKDGTLLHIQRAANPILNKDGEVESILAINMDITNLKLSEKELRIERDNLKTIFEAMEDGVFIGSQEFEIQYLNPVLTNEFGPYEGRKCYEYFNNRDTPCPECQNSTVYAGETVRWEWTSPNNHKIYDLIDTPIKNPDGSISKLEIFRDVSERKKANKTLRESEERYRSIFDNNHSVMLLIDPETAEIVDANPAAVAFYGWSHDELINKKITEINELSKEEVFHAMGQTQKLDKAYNEFIHCLANGEKRDVEVHSNSIRVDEELLLFSVIHDITDRKNAEKKLDEALSRQRSTLRSMSDLVFVLDMEGQFTSCYAPTKTLYIHPEEFLGKKHSEVMPPEVDELFNQAMKKIAKRDVAEYEYSLELTGKKRWYSLKLSPLVQGDELTGAVAVIQDISEHKEAQLVLKQKQRVDKTLINSMPYPIMVINKERVILAANKMARDIGAKVDDYCWRGFSNCEYLSTEDKARALNNPTEPDIQCTHCMADKMFKTNEQQIAPQVEAFGKLWEIYWIPINENEFLHYTIDISDRKHAENILLKTSRMEATATLAAGVAHDFNNLMVGVLGYSELLKSHLEQASAASDMLETIGDCARKAGDLAQQLLAYARGGKYLPKVINLNETILDTLRLNERSFPPRVRIERDFEPELLSINADSSQMSQVLTNLCINSVEAIEKNGRIIITTRNVVLDEKFTSQHPTLQPGRHVYLSVEDTGSGMNDATISKIFEPFFSTKFQGRGLGLAAVYGIVKNHEGYISAYSEVGLGSTFKIYLPAIEAQPLPEPQRLSTEVTGHETILVIDDEKMVLDVTRRMLEISGYHVLVAHDGLEAIKVAENYDETIHLAILDMSMPLLGGSETFPLIKKARPDIKVVISSGFELDAAAQSLLDSGANSFIQKPFRKETLIKVVLEVFDF